MSEQSWITANLVYSGDLDALIRMCVAPLVEDCLALPRVSQFFWVRNQEHGQHIRLRFRGDLAALENEVKPRIAAATSQFFQKSPSFYRSTSPSPNRLPNNSLIFTEYLPESGRYGGPAALKEAEKQFQYSSEIVMYILDKYPTLSTEERLKKSITLQITLAKAFEPEVDKLKQFFRHAHMVRWKKMPPIVYKDIGILHKLPLRRQGVKNFFTSCEFNFDAFIHNVLQSDYLANDDPSLWQYSWAAQMQDIASMMKKLLAENAIILRASWLQYENPLWPLLESLCHMTHNRMGTRNLFEGYLAGMIGGTSEQAKAKTLNDL